MGLSARRFIRASAAIWAACPFETSISMGRRATWTGISACIWNWRGAFSASLGLLKQAIEGVPRIVRVARGRRTHLRRRRHRGAVSGRAVSRNRNPWRKERTLVRFVLHRDPHRNGFQTLEPGGRLEMRTLFTAVEIGVALGTGGAEVDAGRQRSGAVE